MKDFSLSTRLFINFIVFLPFSLYYKYPLLGVPGERVALFTRAFCGFGAVTFGYISYRMIPLSDATTITAACPVFVSIIAWFILKEEFGIFQIFTVALTIIGVALVSKPTFIFGQLGESKISAETRAEGSILALVSCLTAAGVYISIRRLPTTPGLIVINVYCCINVIGAFIVAIILGFFFPQSQFSKGIGVPTTWHEILVLTGGGFAGVIGQICLTSALKIEEAGLIALARTADIIVAFVLQILFISDEIIHWTSYLGAVIVFTAVSVTALRRWLKGKPGQFEQAWNIINCGFARSRDPEM